MTKNDWLQTCADEFHKGGGMPEAEAKQQALITWEGEMLDKGSEDAVLANADPVSSAIDSMSSWEPA